MRKLIGILLLIGIAATVQAQIVFFVRHAEKTADKTDPKLSDIGLKRADCLAETLKDSGITTILTSQVTRTQQTAQPLAKRLNIKPVAIDALKLDEFAKQIKAQKSGNVLVVGHSNTIPGIINQLTGGEMKDLADDDYDHLFIVDLAGVHPSLVTLHYCVAEKR
jgi:2,3-bisphosphoglycerate-dependent phosphoglycerate mutase